MKKSLVLVLAVSMLAGFMVAYAWGDVAIDEEHFPDEVFRAYVLSADVSIDKNQDGCLTDEEIASVTSIDLFRSNVLSLKGIEYFTALQHLNCYSNQLTELDVSNNRALKDLLCGANQLSKLDVSSNTNLEWLDCMLNQLTELDVSNNTRLRELYCHYNQLQTLNLSNNTDYFLALDCSGNQLASLDVSNNICLSFLDCSYNRLTTLDLGNAYLYELNCSNNQLTTLDLSKAATVSHLNCSHNQFSMLDLSNTTELYELDCSDNQLTELDFSANTVFLHKLDCRNNQIRTLNLGKAYLHELDCSNNQLEALDLSEHDSLMMLYCSNNRLITLKVSSGDTDLLEMYCSSNDLTELDVSNNPRLVSLSCSRNHLIKLDISNTPHLASLLCSRNQLIEIDVRNNPNLYELYFYNNRIREINVTKNPKLRNLSCTNNLLSELDISHNPKLQALDCGGNYLATLDLSRNPALTELYFSGTTLRSVDLSANTELISLDCISTDIMPLDLSANSSLDALGSYGNSRLEALYITSTDNPAFPYTTDLREYTGSSYTRITSVKAYSRNDAEIPSSFTQGQYTALFSQHPHYIIYEYDTGYTGTASEDSVPRRMSVRVSVPSLNFTYLPKIESKVVSVDSKVVSVDEAVSFYATSITTPEHPESPSQPEAPDITPEPEPETPDSPTDNAASSSGGGCNSGLGLLASCAVMLIRRKRSALSALCLVPVMASCSWGAGIKTADYTLPIPYETYAISGTYSTNFTLTPELVNTVAEIAHVSSDRIHSFSDISLNESWNVLPIDLYNLSRSGEYGGVVLPMTQNGTQDDRYIIQCTFSDDVSPDEQISLHGFEVDTSTKESVYDENKSYLATFIILDENMTRIERVPENRRVYIALSFRPEYVNTGIVTVVRGRYVEEEDPLYRLGTDAAQRIADDLHIHLEDLKYLTRANIGLPVEPTEAMKAYVKSDDREIIINLPTISVDEEGRYIIPVTLTDEEFELVRSKDIEEFKTYALNDSDLGNGQMRPAFITGLLNTWELYTLSGEKLKTFGVKEFVLVGILNAGKPFSLYLAKLLLALLMGGCDSGIGFVSGVLIIFICVQILLMKKNF